MKKNAKLFVILLLLVLSHLTTLVTTGFSEDENALRIDTAKVKQYTGGTYRIIMFLNQKRPADPDTYFENLMKDPYNYLLKDKRTGEEVKLPTVVQLGVKDSLYQIIIKGVDITHKGKYTIQFRPPLPAVMPKDLVFVEGEGTDKWEEGKGTPWERTVKPKIAQGDSTINELGDLGFELILRRELPEKFQFDFKASVTANKNDPTNHWKLHLLWRTDVWMDSSARFGLRPVTLGLGYDATQALTLHDLSIRAFTSVFIRPFDGIQPLFLTAGLDEAIRIARDGADYDDPRVHLQVQWGFVGLVGRGSEFLIDWEYWRRLDDLGNPKIDPTQDRERQYIELEFKLPIADNKNLTVRYADGNAAPIFTRNTSVHIGLEFLFGGYRVLMPK